MEIRLQGRGQLNTRKNPRANRLQTANTGIFCAWNWEQGNLKKSGSQAPKNVVS